MEDTVTVTDIRTDGILNLAFVSGEGITLYQLYTLKWYWDKQLN